MRDTLIVLGNGFDLDLGWKTSYADFYRAKKYIFDCYDGIKYIKDMMQGEHWYDLEGYIRTCLVEMPESRANELNSFWLVCRNNIFEYLSIGENGIFTTNIHSCAYRFLTGITKKSTILTFNYTNPFTKNNIENHAAEYIHVHGALDNNIQANKIKLGVDSFVRDENSLVTQELAQLLIKSYKNEYIDKVFQLLKTHKNIIFYGHSFGQTDADYFKSYFKHVISGNMSEQNIYLVTKDAKGLQQMKNNLGKYDIEYGDLALSKSNVFPVFTAQGIDNNEFKEILSLI